MANALKLAVTVLQVIAQPYRLLKPQKKIVMLTRQSSAPTLDFVLLENAIKECAPDHKVVILAKKIERTMWGRIKYIFHMLLQLYHIATSHVIVVDGYCIAVSVLPHKKNQKVLQTWHALSIVKKFGYQALDMPNGVNHETADVMKMHTNYDYVLSAGKENTKALSASFRVPEDKMLLMGLPRVDYICQKHPDVLAQMEKDYPQLKERPSILYAPTFRKGKQVKLTSVMKAVDLEKYNLIVKLHPVDRAGFQGVEDSRVICDTKYLSYDWFWECDKIITDYSGVGVEAALANKPVYFYLYDYENYNVKNGLTVDLYEEPIAPYVTKSSGHLAELLKEDYDMSVLEAYRNKYVEVDTHNCSKALAQWLLNLEDELGAMQ